MAQATGSSSRGRWPADSRLYLITASRPDLGDFLEAAISGGVDIVQIRDKQLPDGALLKALATARTVTARHKVPLVVNDRPDLALLAGADFVHVGQDDLSVPDVRRIAAGVGLSTHTPTQIDASEADYIGVGPVFATPTKPDAPVVGLELIRYAPRTRANPGMPSEASQRGTSQTWSTPARSASPSSARSVTLTTLNVRLALYAPSSRREQKEGSSEASRTENHQRSQLGTCMRRPGATLFSLSITRARGKPRARWAAQVCTLGSNGDSRTVACARVLSPNTTDHA